MGIQISLCQGMKFSSYMHRSGIAGGYDSSIFNFLRQLQTCFPAGCTDFYPLPPAVNGGSSFSTSSPTFIDWQFYLLGINFCSSLCLRCSW